MHEKNATTFTPEDTEEMTQRDSETAVSDEAVNPLLSGETCSLSPILTNLERTIARFSDGNILMDSNNNATIEESLIERYSPPGLEEPFKQLHSIIAPSLVRSNIDEDDVNDGMLSTGMTHSVSSSSAAILMGTKGSGKSLLLERVLAACEEQQRHRGGARYRMVSINGIICRGQDVATVVYEIVRQLSDIAFQSTSTSTRTTDGTAGNNDTRNECDEVTAQTEYVRRKRQKTDKHLLRLRKSAFTSNLALLESTLQIADVDRIPVLIVLDELDSFTEEGERQLLLYHFLDRIATPGSNLIFIGITSSFSTLSLLEKRIRSRAEGTAKVIYLQPPRTYADLLNILRHKLNGCVVCEEIMARISSPSDGPDNGDGDYQPKNDTDGVARVSLAMQREFRFGKDIRWFSRVIATALSLYRHDCVVGLEASGTRNPNFRTSHLVDSLVMMGASISESVAATKQPDLCVVNGLAVDPRLQALMDLSTPQVALLLSAKRILTRERNKEQVEAAPLSLERMLKEYESFRRGSSSQGNTKLLRRAALGMLEAGLLVPSMDHSGGGPIQYSVAKSYRNLDPYTFCRLPLQLSVETDRELGKALEEDLLECPTALKEWGRAMR